MRLNGCCPPLAVPRTHLGGEIIGFEPRTGQFVQAAAGPPARVVEYPYYASAGLGSVGANILWGGMAVVLLLAIVVAVQEQREVYR